MPRSRNSVELPEAGDEDGVAAEPAAERRGLAVGRQDTEHSLVTRRRDAGAPGAPATSRSPALPYRATTKSGGPSWPKATTPARKKRRSRRKTRSSPLHVSARD